MTRFLLYSYSLKDRVADAGARGFGNGSGARSVWGVVDSSFGF